MSGLRSIVAEDDPAMQSWLKTVLERMGISVRLVSSGWELLSLLADDEVDLVISDVRMPLPYGLDALAMARTAGVTTPFVMITSFADDHLRERAHVLHATVLDKPFLAAQKEVGRDRLHAPRRASPPRAARIAGATAAE